METYIGIAIFLPNRTEEQLNAFKNILRQCMQFCKIEDTIFITNRNVLSFNDNESYFKYFGNLSVQQIHQSHILLIKRLFTDYDLNSHLHEQVQCFYSRLFHLTTTDEQEFQNNTSIISYTVHDSKTSRKVLEHIHIDLTNQQEQEQEQEKEKEKEKEPCPIDSMELEKLNNELRVLQEQNSQLNNQNNILAANLQQCKNQQAFASQRSAWQRANPEFNFNRKTFKEREREREAAFERAKQQRQQEEQEERERAEREREASERERARQEREREASERERARKEERARQDREREASERAKNARKEQNEEEEVGCPVRNLIPKRLGTKSEFRKLSLKFHPDRNPNCKDLAKEKFQQLSDLNQHLEFGRPRPKNLSYNAFHKTYLSIPKHKNHSDSLIRRKYNKY